MKLVKQQKIDNKKARCYQIIDDQLYEEKPELKVNIETKYVGGNEPEE